MVRMGRGSLVWRFDGVDAMAIADRMSMVEM